MRGPPNNTYVLDFPQLILDIETVELGIAAGLQDRVIQTYGGIVHMDFERSTASSAGGVYTPLDPCLLPELYLVYNIELGGDSGGVHATVKDRWLQGDAEVIAGTLCCIASTPWLTSHVYLNCSNNSTPIDFVL
jgi:glucuronokinase